MKITIFQFFFLKINDIKNQISANGDFYYEHFESNNMFIGHVGRKLLGFF